jgi:hypothetical protein
MSHEKLINDHWKFIETMLHAFAFSCFPSIKAAENDFKKQMSDGFLGIPSDLTPRDNYFYDFIAKEAYKHGAKHREQSDKYTQLELRVAHLENLCSLECGDGK